jgi:predicted metalloendopeptidase
VKSLETTVRTFEEHYKYMLLAFALVNFGQVWCSKFRDQYLLNRILNGHHSPGEFRVIGTTSNSEDFARTFQCRRGQKNNPVKKCSVW